MNEARAVIDYIKELLLLHEKRRIVTQKDIGVVVPYKLQSKVIKRLCKAMNFNDINIGTPEAFQGQEKPIMLVTTVRTDGNFGFLSDPRVSSFACVIVLE